MRWRALFARVFGRARRDRLDGEIRVATRELKQLMCMRQGQCWHDAVEQLIAGKAEAKGTTKSTATSPG